MASEEEALQAQRGLDGKAILGRSLRVSRGARCPGPGVGIEDSELLEACRAALLERSKAALKGVEMAKKASRRRI